MATPRRLRLPPRNTPHQRRQIQENRPTRTIRQLELGRLREHYFSQSTLTTHWIKHRTLTRINSAMRNRYLAVSLFGLLTFGALLIPAAGKPQAGAAASGQAKSPSNLGGQSPPTFEPDIATVGADIDRIEADITTQSDRSTLERPVQVRSPGNLLLIAK